MENNDNTWKGYTLDELRLQRIVTATRIELEKAKMAHTAKPAGNKSAFFATSSVVKKVTGALDYVDYAIIAYQVGRRLIKFFRRKKK